MSSYKIHFLERNYWTAPPPNSDYMGEDTDVEIDSGWAYDQEANLVVADHVNNDDFNWTNMDSIDSPAILIRGRLGDVGFQDEKKVEEGGYENYKDWIKDVRDGLDDSERIVSRGEVALYHNGIGEKEKEELADVLEYFDNVVLEGGLNKIWEELK